MNDETLKIIAERYLGSANCEDYVAWAIACLEENVDSKTIRILSSLRKPLYWSEVDDYFERALAELGWTMPKRNECLREYSRRLAQQIVSGELAPDMGYRKMYRLVDALDYPEELIVWLYLDDGMYPGRSGDFQGLDWEAEIISEAKRMLSS